MLPGTELRPVSFEWCRRSEFLRGRVCFNFVLVEAPTNFSHNSLNADYHSVDCCPTIPGYNFEHVPTPLASGGVGMFIDETLNYKVLERTSNEAFQALWIEISFVKKKNVICGVMYRQHNSPDRFQSYFEETVEKLTSTGKQSTS